DKVRSLLEGVPEADALAAELQRQLLGGGNGVTAPDAGLLAALETAHASLIGDAQIASLRATALAAGTLAADGSNIIIEPGSATQAGVQVLHNPAGAGGVAQNEYRRPAALLAYEVAWENADKVETPVDPPVLVQQVDAPATGQLEFLNALVDVVTGDSPWSPGFSPSLKLGGHEGASRTHYQLVLIGPSGADATWPILSDERFTSFHDQWDD